MSTFKREYPIGCHVFYHGTDDPIGSKLYGYVSFESLQEIMEGDEDFPDDDYLSGNNYTPSGVRDDFVDIYYDHNETTEENFIEFIHDYQKDEFTIGSDWIIDNIVRFVFAKGQQQ